MSQIFQKERESLEVKLLKYIENGGRISLTIDTWSARNYHNFSAVTGHWIDDNWQHNSTTLDCIELIEPIHSGEYLAEKLIEISDSFNVAPAVFVVTQGNASPNNVMLREFEAESSLQQTGYAEQP